MGTNPIAYSRPHLLRLAKDTGLRTHSVTCVGAGAHLPSRPRGNSPSMARSVALCSCTPLHKPSLTGHYELCCVGPMRIALGLMVLVGCAEPRPDCESL